MNDDAATNEEAKGQAWTFAPDFLCGDGAPIPQVGETFGPFRILGRVGTGGMGAVHRAWDPQASREIALKVIRASELDERSRERFKREGELTAKLSYPGILRVHSAGEESGLP